MTAEEIRSTLAGLLHRVFEQPIGSRPRRYQPDDDVLDGLGALARQGEVGAETGAGEWRVVEGRRWLINRRLDGRSVPLVQRDHVAVVVRNWGEARELARLFNWFDTPAPRRSTETPVFVSARPR